MESSVLSLFDKDPEKAAKAFLNSTKVLKVIKQSEELISKGLFKSQADYTKWLNSFARELCYLKLKNESVKDKVLMQASVALTEIDQSINIYYERLMEMYGLYFPEAIRKINNINKLIKLLDKPDREQASKELNLTTKSLGFNLPDEDLNLIKLYASRIKEAVKLRQDVEEYLVNKVKKLAPRLSEIATPLIATKLVTLAGGLTRLAKMPASTIQILGAEKALFRHLRKGSKPPKYGVIAQHPSITSAKLKEKGKTSRKLANKIALAVRSDYYEEGK